MATFSDYPKTMRHPAHAPAVVGDRVVDRRGKVSYGQGEPERFPDVYVNTIEQEEEERAKGYVAFGETPEKPLPEDWSEYPVCLVHPEHKDAIPDELHAVRETDGSMSRWTVPGTPEKFPHVFASDELEEQEWIDKGYARQGKSDPDAVTTSRAVIYVPGRVVSEYPKWVDGKLVQDPRLVIGGVEQYPKYISAHDKIVHGPEEEAALLGHILEEPEPLHAPEVAEAQRELAALRAELAALKATAVQPAPTTEE